jgi:hypothetical protein
MVNQKAEEISDWGDKEKTFANCFSYFAKILLCEKYYRNVGGYIRMHLETLIDVTDVTDVTDLCFLKFFLQQSAYSKSLIPSLPRRLAFLHKMGVRWTKKLTSENGHYPLPYISPPLTRALSPSPLKL